LSDNTAADRIGGHPAATCTGGFGAASFGRAERVRTKPLRTDTCQALSLCENLADRACKTLETARTGGRGRRASNRATSRVGAAELAVLPLARRCGGHNAVRRARRIDEAAGTTRNAGIVAANRAVAEVLTTGRGGTTGRAQDLAERAGETGDAARSSDRTRARVSGANCAIAAIGALKASAAGGGINDATTSIGTRQREAARAARRTCFVVADGVGTGPCAAIGEAVGLRSDRAVGRTRSVHDAARTGGCRDDAWIRCTRCARAAPCAYATAVGLIGQLTPNSTSGSDAARANRIDTCLTGKDGTGGTEAEKGSALRATGISIGHDADCGTVGAGETTCTGIGWLCGGWGSDGEKGKTTQRSGAQLPRGASEGRQRKHQRSPA